MQLTGAPADALAPKDTGTLALKRTAAGEAPAADSWERTRCREDQVYLYGGPNPVIDSHTGRLEFVAYKGKASAPVWRGSVGGSWGMAALGDGPSKYNGGQAATPE